MPKAAKDRRDVGLMVRVTPEERRLLVRCAEWAGLSQSAWMRVILLAAARGAKADRSDARSDNKGTEHA